jgi:hypothetical protein
MAERGLANSDNYDKGKVIVGAAAGGLGDMVDPAGPVGEFHEEVTCSVFEG